MCKYCRTEKQQLQIIFKKIITMDQSTDKSTLKIIKLMITHPFFPIRKVLTTEMETQILQPNLKTKILIFVTEILPVRSLIFQRQ